MDPDNGAALARMALAATLEARCGWNGRIAGHPV